MFLEKFDAWKKDRFAPTIEEFEQFVQDTYLDDVNEETGTVDINTFMVDVASQLYEIQVCLEGLMEDLEDENE